MLQSLRIKLSEQPRKKSTSLWEDSPCSHNYVTKSIDIHYKTPRFQIGSIYYRDEVNKQKKVFNQFEKPDLLLQDFRRQIQEASHPKYNTAAKKNKQISDKQKYKAKSMSMTSGSHLYQIPTQIGYAYDRNGYRTHLTGKYNVKDIQNKVKDSKRNFSFGRRLDLSRPLNFYPGPGSYNNNISSTQRFSRLAKTSSQWSKKKSNRQNPQTQRYHNENFDKR